MSRYNKISQNQDCINNFLDDYYQEFQKSMKERRDGRYNSRRPDMRRNRVIQDCVMSQPLPPGSHGPYEAGNGSSVHPYHNNDVSMRMEYSYPPPFNPNVPPPLNPNVPPMYPQPYSDAPVPPQYSTLHMPPPLMIPVNHPPLPPVPVGPPLPISPPPLPPLPPPPLPSSHVVVPSLPPPPGTAVIVLPTNHRNSDEDSGNEDEEEEGKDTASSAKLRAVTKIKENIVDYSNSSSDSSDHLTQIPHRTPVEENNINPESSQSKETNVSLQSPQKNDSTVSSNSCLGTEQVKSLNNVPSQESSACETLSQVGMNVDSVQNILNVNCNDVKLGTGPESRTFLQNSNFRSNVKKSVAVDFFEEHTTPSDISDHEKEISTSVYQSDGIRNPDSSDMLSFSHYPGPPLSPPPSPFLSREIYLKFHEIWVQQMEEEEMEARRNYLQREIEKHDRKHYSSKRHRKDKKLKRRLKIYGENILMDKKKHKNHSAQDSLRLDWGREQKIVSSTVDSVMKTLLHDLTETLKSELSRRLLDEAVSKLNEKLSDGNVIATE